MMRTDAGWCLENIDGITCESCGSTNTVDVGHSRGRREPREEWHEALCAACGHLTRQECAHD